MNGAGLDITDLVRIVRDQVATDRLGDLLRRLPARFYDRELERFRPVTPAVLIAMAVVDEPELDAEIADLVEFVSCDPAPEQSAWTTTPDGQMLRISNILALTARRMAELYSKPRSSSRSKKTALIA